MELTRHAEMALTEAYRRTESISVSISDGRRVQEWSIICTCIWCALERATRALCRSSATSASSPKSWDRALSGAAIFRAACQRRRLTRELAEHEE